PYAPFPPTLDQEDGTVYSWALNNIWDTNFPAQQQGETTFRYAVTSEAGVQGRRLGAAAAAGLTEPFAGVLITEGPSSEEEYVSVDHPDVLVTSLGWDGVRLQSLAAEPVTVRVSRQGHETAEVRLPACGVAVVRGTRQ
ncbi:glycoside hydrolase family 38 C-terminal domain-containing protein, partial [Nonomuraea sp. NPDC004297]